MILTGSRLRVSTVGAGEFDCPECEGSHKFKHQRVRNYFTFWFLPVLPLRLKGEYVECQRCQCTFDTKVLQQPVDPEHIAAIKRVIFGMMLADRNVSAAEKTEARHIYEHVTGKSVTDAEIDAAVEAARSEKKSVYATLKKLAPRLNDQGKEYVLKAAFHVATAEGEYQRQEKQLVGLIGSAIGWSPSRVQDCIQALHRAASDPH